MKNSEPKKTKQEPAPDTSPPDDLSPEDKEAVRRELRFLEIGKTEGGDKENRLRGLFAKWRNPVEFALKGTEETELLDYKIILPMATAAEVNVSQIANVDICDSQGELAKRMMIHFQNPDKTSKLRIEITKITISEWSRGKRLAANIPPFPKAAGTRKHRYSLQACIDWFNAWLWHDYRADANQTNGAAPSPFVPIGELRDKVERAEAEKRLFDIEVAKGGYIATPKAAAILGSAMRRHHGSLKGQLENTSPELFEIFCRSISLTPEQIFALKDFQAKEYQRIIDTLEMEADRIADENQNQIIQQVKHDLGK
jgi:hypothetical protein